MSTIHRQDGGRLTLTDNLPCPTAAEGIIGIGKYNLALPTYTDGDVGFFQLTSDGRLRTDTNVTVENIDVQLGAVEIKNAADDTRAVVKDDGTENALVVTMNALPEGSTVLSTGDNVVGRFKIVGVDGTNVATVVGGLLQVGIADVVAGMDATVPQAYGVDAAGADAYTTIVTVAGGAKYHMSYSVQGAYDAVISLDGTTDHFYVPANSAGVFDDVVIANGATVQGKNAGAGENYTNLAITIW